MTMRSNQELLDQLNEQLEFLRKSCESFDEGNHSEAKRIAIALRVILHDGKNSVSILKQLRIKESIEFLDSIPKINPNNLLPSSDFLKIKVDSGNISYSPMLKDSPFFDVKNRCKFGIWESEPIYKNKSLLWSRADFILKLANKEGGAHVDPKPDANYKSIVEEGKERWTLNRNTNLNTQTEALNPEENIVFVALRQIGFEVLETLISHDWNKFTEIN